MAIYRMLVINPGSTSTKVSVFDGRSEVFTQSVFHDAPQLLAFPTVNDQMDMRMGVVESMLEAHGIKWDSIDAFIGRGGCAYSQQAGVMVIDEALEEDTRLDRGGSDHPAKLGVLMAYRLGVRHGKPMFTVDSTNVDELCDYARVTGIKGVYRRAQTHVLNQKATARIHARSLGKAYEDCSFIVCHIDGGITVTAHQHGRMVDSTEGAGGDGPFSPTRLGSVPVIELLKYLEEESSIEDARKMCSRSGGLASHFGTSDAGRIHDRCCCGDKMAALVWNSMIYQICKSIGAMSAVLCGSVDGIILTGGLVRFVDIVDGIRERCGWIAPISVYPGEVEQEAMAFAVLEVLEGRAEARRYTGRPVWNGFGF